VESDPLQLVEAEIPRLRRFARYLGREPDVADDLVQECLTRAVAHIDSWRPGTNLRAWLFTILRNCHISEARRQSRNPAIDGVEVADSPAVATPGGQEAYVAMQELRRAYATLSAEHREVLLLVAVEGMAYEEAASVLEVPVGTVRSRLSRARQALRRAMDDGLGLPGATSLLRRAGGHDV
jgi:RNA polymerase sigma-70 factor (ECF subfamily)